MVFVPTPRTVEAPPDPGSHILPTPGQTPLVALDDSARLADVAAPAVVDESTMDVPAKIMVAIAIGSADFRNWTSPLQNILTPTPL